MGSTSSRDDSDRPRLAHCLRQKIQRKGKQHRERYKGSDEELKAIVEWLESLDDDD